MRRHADQTIISLARETEPLAAEYFARAAKDIATEISKCNSDSLGALQAANRYATRRASGIARSLTIDRWFWFLRRLSPAVFDQSPQHLQVHDWYFAETFAALHSASGVMVGGGSLLRTKTARSMLMFAVYVLWVSNLRARLRCARLGAPFDQSTPIPSLIQEHPISAALALADERRVLEGVPFARWGTLAGALWRAAPSFTATVFFRSTSPQWTDVADLGRALDPVEVWSWFYARRLDLTPVLHALADDDLGTFDGSDVLNIIMLLRVLETLVVMGTGPAEELLTTGMCYVDRKLFDFACHDAIPKTWASASAQCERFGAARSSHELEAALRRKPLSLEPLRSGPLLFEITNGIALNAAAASQELSASLEFPAIDGQPANRRAETFEVELQQMIDSSPGAPSPKVHELVRRHLRLDRHRITDIDAVAEISGTVILVSCKSVPMRAAYDAGDPRLIHNVSTALEKAVDEWVEKLAVIVANPQGDNYDLRGRRCVGIVCTPLVMQVPVGRATEFVLPGLRRYSSATELAQWLRRPSAPTSSASRTSESS
jgi:hypothetical protein